MTDPITDMLNRIKNAQAVSHKTVDVPHSKLKLEIAKILEREGFIESFDTHGRTTSKIIRINLQYDEGIARMQGMRRLSRPGQKLYAAHKAIPSVRYGKGSVIISTSQGLMTNREARKKKMGGELLFEVW